MQKRSFLLVTVFALLACQGCWQKAKTKSNNVANSDTNQETLTAVKNMQAAQNKAFANSPLVLAPPPCSAERKKAEELMQTNPGADESAQANLDLMNCTLKITNSVKCKGKQQPCGLVPYNPPIKANEPPPTPQLVDVSQPSQVSNACAAIGAAAGIALTGAANPAVGVTLGSAAGDYSCGAYFQAAAKNDPILLIAPQFVPTVQLSRDLKQITGGTVDLTPEEAAKNATQALQRSVITVKVAAVDIPVAALPIVPVGGTPAKVLNDGAGAVQQGVTHLAGEVGKVCKNWLGVICH